MIQNKAVVSVVGCGYWGRNLVRNFSELGELRSVCDPHFQNAESMSVTYKVPAQSFEEVLADETVWGVVIATPAITHADLACRALLAGKDVMVEKPIALSIEDAESMIRTAKSCDKLLMVGHLLNYHPGFLKVVDIVKSGSLGKIRRIYSNRLSLGKLRTDENVLWSFAPHDVSMILRLADGKAPLTVEAYGASYITSHIADFAHLFLGFESGLTAHIYTSWLHPFKEQKLVVIGELGMVVFDDTLPVGNKVAVYDHKVESENGHPIIKKAEARFIQIGDSEPLKNECQAFVDGMRNKSSVYTSGDEGIKVLDVLSRADFSLKSKQ